MKVIRVNDDVHKRIKVDAYFAGQSIGEYITALYENGSGTPKPRKTAEKKSVKPKEDIGRLPRPEPEKIPDYVPTQISTPQEAVSAASRLPEEAGFDSLQKGVYGRKSKKGSRK